MNEIFKIVCYVAGLEREQITTLNNKKVRYIFSFLCYKNGYSLKEIGEFLSVSPEAVHYQIKKLKIHKDEPTKKILKQSNELTKKYYQELNNSKNRIINKIIN